MPKVVVIAMKIMADVVLINVIIVAQSSPSLPWNGNVELPCLILILFVYYFHGELQLKF